MGRFPARAVTIALTVTLLAGAPAAPALADDPVPTTTTEPAPTTTTTEPPAPPPSEPAPPSTTARRSTTVPVPSSIPPSGPTSTSSHPPAPPAPAPADGIADLHVTTQFDKTSYIGSDLVRITVTIANIGTADAPNVKGATGGTVDVRDSWGELGEWTPGVLIKAGETRVVVLSGYIFEAWDHRVVIGGNISSSVADANYDDNWVTASAALVDATGDFGGQIFQDSNANGVADPGEGGLAGVKISISGGVPAQQFERTTDAAGKFSFHAIPTGRYSVYYNAPPPWTVNGITDGYSESIVIDPGSYANVRISAVHYLSYTLTASFWFDRDTYQPGETARLMAVLTNTGDNPLSGVRVDTCSGTNSPGLRGREGWGPLAEGGPGVTVPPRSTRVVEVSEKVPDVSPKWGYVSASCWLRANNHSRYDQVRTEDTARVPGVRTSARGTIYQKLIDNGRVDDGEGLPDVAVVLSDPYTGSEVARVRTDAKGAFVASDVPAGRYDLRVDGPWKPPRFFIGWHQIAVFEGERWWNDEFEVQPGSEQENKLPKLVGIAAFDKSAYNSGDDLRLHLTVKNIGQATARGVHLSVGGNGPNMTYDTNQLGDFVSWRPGALIEPGASRELDVVGSVQDANAGAVTVSGAFMGTGSSNDFWSLGFRAIARITATRGDYAGIVYGDRNNNNAMDPGESLGRMPVELRQWTGGGYGTFRTTTAPDGRFAFKDLPTGRYFATYHLSGGWMVNNHDVVVIDEQDHGEVLVRAVRSLSETLVVSLKFTKHTYKAGERAHLTAIFTNSGTTDVAGLTALCAGFGADYEIVDTPQGWGPLAYGEAGITVAAGKSRTLDVWSIVPEGAYKFGFVTAGCAFTTSPDTADGPSAGDRAGVPGGIGSATGRLVYDPQNDGRYDGEGVPNTEIVLVNEETGRVEARTVTDGQGRFAFRDLPANRYETRVLGPWKITGDPRGQILAGETYDWRELLVIPGAIQPDPDAPPVDNEPAPQAGVAPPAARRLATTGATVVELSIVGVVALAMGLGMVLAFARRRRRT